VARDSGLEEQARVNRGQPVALIAHKPVTAPGTELAAAPPYRFWPRPAFRRLTGLSGGRPAELVLSGHLHQYRMMTLYSTDHLWYPRPGRSFPTRRSRSSASNGAGSCRSPSPPGTGDAGAH